METFTEKSFHVRFIFILIKSETADFLRICNAKIYLTVERQSNYLQNNHRNSKLPIYLVTNNPGLKSGFMITHYSINSLA